MNGKANRLSRAKKTRACIARLSKPRLCVFRTNKHMYAQIISSDNTEILASVSTAAAAVKNKIANGGNKAAAAMIGELIALKAKELGLSAVAFDRSGFKYHGRVSALAEAARENGLLI